MLYRVATAFSLYAILTSAEVSLRGSYGEEKLTPQHQTWDPTGRLPAECLGAFVKIPNRTSQQQRHLCQDSSGIVTIFEDTDLANEALVTNRGSLLVGTGDVKQVLKLRDGSVAAILKGKDENVYIYDDEVKDGWQMRMPPSHKLRAEGRGDLVSLAELSDMSLVAAGTTKSTIVLFANHSAERGGRFKGELSFCNGSATLSSGLLSQLQDGSLIASTGSYKTSCGIDIYSRKALQDAMKSHVAQAPTSHISVEAPIFGQVQLKNGSLAVAVNNGACELRIYEPKRWRQARVIKLPGQCGPGGVSFIDKDTLGVALNGDIGGDSSKPMCLVALDEPVPQCLHSHQFYSNSVNGMLQMDDGQHFLISTDDAIWIYAKRGSKGAPNVVGRLDTGSVSAYSMFETEGPKGDSILGVGSQEGVVLLFPDWENAIGTNHQGAKAAAVLVDAVDLQHATLLSNGSLLIPKVSEAKLQLWSSHDLAGAKDNATATLELDVPSKCIGTSSSQWNPYLLPPVELSSGFIFIACDSDTIFLNASTNTYHTIDLLGPISELIEVSGEGALLAIVAGSSQQQYYIQRLEFNATSQTYQTASETILGPIVQFPDPAPTLKLFDVNSKCVALQNDTSVTLWTHSGSGYAKTGDLTQKASTRKWMQLKDGSLMGLSDVSISRFEISDLGSCQGAIQNSSFLDVSKTTEGRSQDHLRSDPAQLVKSVESLTELHAGALAVGVMDVHFWRHVIGFSNGQPQWTFHVNEASHAIENFEQVSIRYNSSYCEEAWFVYAPTTSAVWSSTC